MKLAERTCGNCAWFKPSPAEANHDVPSGFCQLEPLAVNKSSADRCSHHDTVGEATGHFEGFGYCGRVPDNVPPPGGDVMLARIGAETVRERGEQPVDIRKLFDPDFTSGLDPVEYLEKLHEGRLG